MEQNLKLNTIKSFTFGKFNCLTKFYSYMKNYFLKKEHNLINDDNKNMPFSNKFLENLILNIKENNDDENSDEELQLHNYRILDDNKCIFYSYPNYNYLKLISNNLYSSLKKGKFIFDFYELKGFNDQTQSVIENINKNTLEINKENIEEILKLIEKEDNINEIDNNLNELIEIILESLGERGILTFLGLRTTPGSLSTHLPPNINKLKDYFNELHTKDLPKNKKVKSSILTVGARALCKHSNRSSEGFWPEQNGKEIEKNQKAKEIMNRIINDAIWINIHGLPGDIPIIEVRNKEGYGIRWQVDGVFRGFLEPQMEDGHEKAWKH